MRLSYCPKCGYKKKRGQAPRTVHASTGIQTFSGSHSAIFEICRGCGFQFYISYPTTVGDMDYDPQVWEPASIVNPRVKKNRLRRRHRRSILVRSRCPTR